jgi:hypothetical protein
MLHYTQYQVFNGDKHQELAILQHMTSFIIKNVEAMFGPTINPKFYAGIQPTLTKTKLHSYTALHIQS